MTFLVWLVHVLHDAQHDPYELLVLSQGLRIVHVHSVLADGVKPPGDGVVELGVARPRPIGRRRRR